MRDIPAWAACIKARGRKPPSLLGCGRRARDPEALGPEVLGLRARGLPVRGLQVHGLEVRAREVSSPRA
ncbi:hypothetical protein Scani_62790 [Streptomyces caniferus]|uniref:Uncharacterized protein n=1 Tax=Streptomyces caniferus TaxID=285557 RepID=A0A640SI20_9ACTN|nr:hypothetical protein Scani_62790 [Streptomyces caniferus]